MSSGQTAAASNAFWCNVSISSAPACELCSGAGGDVVVRTDKLRIVLVDDARYPGFCRVIWQAHAREMTDLPEADRSLLMQAVWQVEEAVREVMQPHKVNVASLGNVVPHLHWHVIPRFVDDAHFPDPVWAAVRREPGTDLDAAQMTSRKALVPQLRHALARRFSPAS